MPRNSPVEDHGNWTTEMIRVTVGVSLEESLRSLTFSNAVTGFDRV